jgi:glyoxylase-like metal-dependent hydrolase (beta-lactamase superfamily II)
VNGPRVFLAENAGPFTLGGTRTFVVGREVVAVVDPGPDDPAHLERVALEVAGAREGTILVTHGHPDHAAGAPHLSRLTGFPTAGSAAGVDRALTGGDAPGVDRALTGGDRIPVDGGSLEAVETPGHSRRHLAFLHHPARELFVGDLLIGKGDTTWVGEYPGCVGDYLASLDRVDALSPTRIHPAHGPSLDDPVEAVARFREHRLARVRQVKQALEAMGIQPGAEAAFGGVEDVEAAAGDPDALVGRVVERVYGSDLPSGVRLAAVWSARALLEYLGVLPFPREGAPTEQGDSLAAGS